MRHTTSGAQSVGILAFFFLANSNKHGSVHPQSSAGEFRESTPQNMRSVILQRARFLHAIHANPGDRRGVERKIPDPGDDDNEMRLGRCGGSWRVRRRHDLIGSGVDTRGGRTWDCETGPNARVERMQIENNDLEPSPYQAPDQAM